jgi:hypothetical protein
LWLAGIGLADRAAAQVAVPPLTPISPMLNGNSGTLLAGFVLLNPAAQQWGAPSRIGLGMIQNETDIMRQGTYDQDGRLAGFRWVGMRFGLSLEALSIRGDYDVSRDYSLDQTNVALSMRPLGPVAVGAGYYRQEFEDNPIFNKVTTIAGGASLRIGELIYLGIAGGEDTQEYEDRNFEGTGETYSHTADRNFTAYGAAIRRGGTLSFHLEWFAVDREAYNLQNSEFSDLKSQNGVLEIGLWSIIVGARVSQVDEEMGGNRYKTDAKVYDLAWAPFRGLTLGGRYEITEETDESTDTDIENEVRAITLGWQF